MKTVKIFALLLILGISQAGATGFAHNMNKAQQMLKGKKEVVNSCDTVKPKSESEKGESKKVASVDEEAQGGNSISENLIGTLVEWMSHALVTYAKARF